MRPFLATLRIRARTEMTYRAAAISGMVTQLFFGLVLVFLYQALYSGGGGRAVPDLAQLITYVWLQQILFRIVFHSDNTLFISAKNGDLACDLCRPVNIYAYAVARDIAGRVVTCAMRAPVFIAALLLLPASIRLGPPVSIQSFCAFLLSLASGVLVVSMIQCITLGLTLRTLDQSGPNALTLMLTQLGSGNLIPLDLLPDGMLRVVRVLPFSQIVDTPIRFYTGQLPLCELPLALAGQCAWVALLFALGLFLWNRNVRKWVVQGG